MCVLLQATSSQRLKELNTTLAQVAAKGKHAFWDTQPVLPLGLGGKGCTRFCSVFEPLDVEVAPITVLCFRLVLPFVQTLLLCPRRTTAPLSPSAKKYAQSRIPSPRATAGALWT